MENTKTGAQWVEILKNNPTTEQCEWEKLDGHDWQLLLEWQPQFADRCPWEKLTTQDWCMLLHVHPNFAQKYNCPFEEFTSWDWAELLDHCPQFGDYCDFSKLDGGELYLIFSNQPSLIKKELIPQLGKRLVDFLCDYPQYISDYAKLIATESVIAEIKLLLKEEYQVQTEIQVMSMYSKEEAYVAKIVNVDTKSKCYKDIYFYKGDQIFPANATGKSITEATLKLYAFVRDCWRKDFLVGCN